jgi:hypothetical protein
MRPEEEPDFDKPAWRPTWKCFCCHDTGIVISHLAEQVIDGYDSNRDKLPRCQNPGCVSGSHFDGSNFIHCIDYRLTSEICQELDAREREDWNEMLLFQHRRRVEIRELAEKMNLRKRDRTPEEEQIARTRHKENRLLSPKEQDDCRAAVLGESDV